jgi:6-phosphogluconolactonase
MESENFLMPRPNYEVFPDKDALSRHAAELFVQHAQQAALKQTPFRVALAGGSTPATLYRLLASAEYKSRVVWGNVELYFGDERCVPPDDADSNFRMVKESLLEELGEIPVSIFFMMCGIDPDQGAQHYEETLRTGFDIDHDAVPRFDMILLGMGADGHTASLFPHKASLQVTDRLVVPAEPGLKPFVTRLTLTYPVLNNAANVLFLVAGEDKAETVKRVFDGETLPEELPSQAVQPTAGELLWLLDQSAASQL